MVVCWEILFSLRLEKYMVRGGFVSFVMLFNRLLLMFVVILSDCCLVIGRWMWKSSSRVIRVMIVVIFVLSRCRFS